MMMKKSLYVLYLFAFLFLGCDEVELIPECVQGKIIGKEQCSDFILIEVLSPSNVGESITYYDGTSYSRVIKIVPKNGVQITQDGFYRVRIYDPEKDADLHELVICQTLYAPFAVPAMVGKAFSETSCP
ncbi:hypothetical protein IFO69_12620 [Echinicola sp. CAU 1574]|uniref:Uncharacterized protein n=1 Tax=Echinicola arenosa TaxID=2774144 RepID=A0ABR9AMQ2_9BACT|nr:hypothetical protein [Echinicola arenosa]MBD8489591.1 hypothetical protein [Echinicola arenosa]